METLKISNLPLNMPEKENLYRMPKHPYQFPTHGIIRGKDFSDLLTILFRHHRDEEILSQELDARFDYHVINNMFPEWNLQELADFARHTLMLNKDAVGWDQVDTAILELNNITIPGWRLPNFDFIEEFENVLNQIQKLYFPERLRDLIHRILEATKIEEIQLDRDVKKHLHLWSIKDLWLLLSYLTKRKHKFKEEEGIQQIINLVSTKFEELVDSGTLGVKPKICIILLYIDALDGMNKQITMRSKELIDRIWMDIKGLEYSEKISFKYLLGAAYSMVGQHLFKQDTDFVTRKLFIDNFIHNYVSEDYDLGRWFADLLDYEMNELIFDLLIRGYSKTIPLLHQHAIELPPSKTKEDVERRIQQFNGVLADIIIFYLEIPDELNEKILEELKDKFVKKLQFDKTRMNMLELLYRVAISSVFYNPEFTTTRKNQLQKLTSYLLRHLVDDFRADIFEIDYEINSGIYPFEKLYEQINNEVEEAQSIVLSETFEIEIVQKISTAIAYTDDLITREDLYLEIYEVILQFLLDWLAVFSRSIYDFKEVLMIFSPLVNICFFHQIRWYYENNFPKKAFLMNLNLHSFMNYFSNRLDRFEKMKFERMEISSHKGISEKYREITERWEVRDLLKQHEIKEMIIDTRDKFKRSGLNQRRSTGNLIEDALIHGYLDEIDRLEHFIATDYSHHKTGNLENLLLESGIYQKGNPESACRMEKIGSNQSETEIIPVPLFNNIHKLSIASELFEIKDASIDTIEERNKNIQQKYAQIT